MRTKRVQTLLAPVADIRKLDLTPRRFRTEFGGIFLFIHDLARLDIDGLAESSGLRSAACLLFKPARRARKSHVMAELLDEGLARFAGLNAIFTRSMLTRYRSRVDPLSTEDLMRHRHDIVHGMPCHSAQACPSIRTSTRSRITATTR